MSAFAQAVRAATRAMNEDRYHVVYAEGWDHGIDEFAGEGRCVATAVNGQGAWAAFRWAAAEGPKLGWKGRPYITHMDGRLALAAGLAAGVA